MRLTFEKFDGRRLASSEIIDEDTGKTVGWIQSGGTGTYRSGGIWVHLFGEKYTAVCNTHDECLGFVRGVQAVLNEMTSTVVKRSSEDHVKKAS